MTKPINTAFKTNQSKSSLLRYICDFEITNLGLYQPKFSSTDRIYVKDIENSIEGYLLWWDYLYMYVVDHEFKLQEVGLRDDCWIQEVEVEEDLHECLNSQVQLQILNLLGSGCDDIRTAGVIRSNVELFKDNPVMALSALAEMADKSSTDLSDDCIGKLDARVSLEVKDILAEIKNSLYSAVSSIGKAAWTEYHSRAIQHS